MRLHRVTTLILCLYLDLTPVHANSKYDPSGLTLGSACTDDTIEEIDRDVIVLGGGSTGTFAAVQLKARNVSVAVVEWNGWLGGNTETYYSPQGSAVNIGVEVFHPDNITKQYFQRLQVPLKTAEYGSVGTCYVDFTSGDPVTDAVPDVNASTAALEKYVNLMSNYSYLWSGFDLPYPVPSDLLIPFSDYLEKYAIGDYLRPLFNYYEGMGNLLEQPTIYVMKNLNPESIRSSLGGKMLTTASGDNQDLYRSAYQNIGAENVYLLSSTISVDRSGDGCRHSSPVKMLISTTSGLKLIRAKKMVVTIPPLLENFQGWDLDSHERSVFTQFVHTGYWTGLIYAPALNHSTAYVNAGSRTPYHLPAGPGLYNLQPVAALPHVFSTKFGSSTLMNDEQVRSHIEAEIQTIQQGLGLNETQSHFLVFRSHTPFEITVPATAIGDGFYRDLYALQGRNHTYYTGGAWHTYDSSYLWAFTQKVLNRLVKDLEADY